VGAHDWGITDDTQAMSKVELLEAQIQNVDVYFIDGWASDAPFAANSDKTVRFSSSWDPNMLHRAEWIKYLAAFFNLEDKAEDHFDMVSAKWNQPRTSSGKKVVIIQKVTGNPAWGTVDALKVEADAVKVSWVETAGATLIGKDEAVTAGGVVAAGTCTGGAACDIDFDPADEVQAAAFRDLIATADIIIDETSNYYASTTYGASEFETNFGVDLSAKIYRNDGLMKAIGGGSAWFETSQSSPHIVVEELSSLVHGETMTRVFLRRLDESQTMKTEADCDKEMPACGGTVTAIEAPCETYLTCVKITPESSSVAAALLLAAAAFA